ncbi:MAG: flavodoxin domain-containing protein [Pseudomonadota bacterium]
MNIHFLFGTETGTAEMLCEDLQGVFSGTHQCTIKGLDEVKPDGLSTDGLTIFVCSTFGAGDLPSNAEGFVANLSRTKPDLSTLRFAIFGLGDRTFGPTFAQGSEKLMAALKECGAQMLGERGIFDASGPDMPEDVAEPWLEDVLNQA